MVRTVTESAAGRGAACALITAVGLLATTAPGNAAPAAPADSAGAAAPANAAAAPAASGGPVATAPAGPAAQARTSDHAVLTLSVRDGQGAAAPLIRTVELTCGPDAGTHPHAAAACRALAAVHGRFHRLPGDPGVCPMIYRPATAVADGHWGARPVRFTKTYSNTCRLHQALAPVYDF